MSYNENTQKVLDIIDDISDTLETLTTSIDNGSKGIEEDKVTDDVVESWEKLKENVDAVVTQATDSDDAWLFDLNDTGIAGEGDEE